LDAISEDRTPTPDEVAYARDKLIPFLEDVKSLFK